MFFELNEVEHFWWNVNDHEDLIKEDYTGKQD